VCSSHGNARNVKAQNVKSIEETHNEKSNSKNQKANETMKLTLNHTTIKVTAGE
jgi:hypothetical protein